MRGFGFGYVGSINLARNICAFFTVSSSFLMLMDRHVKAEVQDANKQSEKALDNLVNMENQTGSEDIDAYISQKLILNQELNLDNFLSSQNKLYHESSKEVTYIVKKGDTLSGIARTHGVSLEQLIRINRHIKNPDLIYPGDKIYLSATTVFRLGSKFLQGVVLDDLGTVARVEPVRQPDYEVVKGSENPKGVSEVRREERTLPILPDSKVDGTDLPRRDRLPVEGRDGVPLFESFNLNVGSVRKLPVDLFQKRIDRSLPPINGIERRSFENSLHDKGNENLLGFGYLEGIHRHFVPFSKTYFRLMFNLDGYGLRRTRQVQYIWPASGVITSGFGDFRGGGRRHKGIDIANAVGTPIYAAAEGKVIFSGWSSGGYGNLVVLEHENGAQTFYAHNLRNRVFSGQYVAQGQWIADMGSTGFSTGSHLHFEVRTPQNGYLTHIDPKRLLPRSILASRI